MSDARSASSPAGAPPATDCAPDAPPPERSTAKIDSLLEVVDAPVARPQPAVAAPSGMRSAALVAVDNDVATVRLRGTREPVAATVAAGVAPELLRHALERGDPVLVECDPGAAPVVVGVLMTKLPAKLELKADVIHIDAERELLLRSGRAAIRLRQDGDVEIVGTRISAASRGLFKLVGRILRLN